MALFTDGISTIQDLAAQDSSVLATAQTENIDLSQKLTLAQQELGIEVTTLLQRSNTYDWQFWLQPDPQLNNIVVTPPLQLWHVFQTLTLVYQDCLLQSTERPLSRPRGINFSSWRSGPWTS